MEVRVSLLASAANVLYASIAAQGGDAASAERGIPSNSRIEEGSGGCGAGGKAAMSKLLVLK